jgi:multidrug efflux pump subunit AcrA (membrane-fusion protein)
VQIDNPRGRLRPGMYAEAELVLERVNDALLVPAGAVLERGGESALFVLAPGADPPRAMLRRVRTGLGGGLSRGEEVQILSGLEPGESVVVEGNAFLEDGQAVRPARAP